MLREICTCVYQQKRYTDLMTINFKTKVFEIVLSKTNFSNFEILKCFFNLQREGHNDFVCQHRFQLKYVLNCPYQALHLLLDY